MFHQLFHKDEKFAQRLHADLQNKGVRCWFAPHDLPIGGKLLDTIDEAIRLHDKVLIVLSEQSLGSDWVENEVKTAFDIFGSELPDEVFAGVFDRSHLGSWREVDL